MNRALLFAGVAVAGTALAAVNSRRADRTRSIARAGMLEQARFASLINVVPQLVWTADVAGRIEHVNDRWSAFTNLQLEETRRAGWTAVVHPDDREGVAKRWRDALYGADPVALEARLRNGTTLAYGWHLVNIVPVLQHGVIAGWIGTCTDIAAQKRLEEREAFLARTGEWLSASLDVAMTLSAISGLLVPQVAERLRIALRDEHGHFVLRGAVDTRGEADARRMLDTPFAPEAHERLLALVADGTPVMIDPNDAVLGAFFDTASSRNVFLLPLQSGATSIGALALELAGDSTLRIDDVMPVREFARRAALSLDRARLYEREHATADALQRAMLPARLPDIDGLCFSASYSAASESQRVGGDFYDAFLLPDGRVALTIGDVTGHGLEAAVIMGEIRNAIRSAAFEYTEPSMVLDRASRLLVAAGRELFATAIFGVLDLRTAWFTYATAGHPSPLLLNDSTVEWLAGSGLPIGLRDDAGVDFSVRLHTPSTLVFYTDGLIEFTRDLFEGERRLELAARRLADEPIDHFAAALMKNVLGDDVPDDDIAVLTVSIEAFSDELPGDDRSWRFAADDPRAAAIVRREIGRCVASWTGRDDAEFVSELAFGEMIANVVRHAPGTALVELQSDGGIVTLSVEDGGPGFAPVRNAPDPMDTTGRGLALMRGVTDGLHVEATHDGGTRVVVTFETAPELHTSAS